MSKMSRKIQKNQQHNDMDRAKADPAAKPWYRRAFKPMDYLIALIAIYLFGFNIDYGNMGLLEIAYCVAFGIWFVLLIVRGYIYYSGRAS